MLRDVTNGTAVEEADGIRRWHAATRYQAWEVRSIFRWGNRLIVATSKV
jgi:hypothetical protein